MIGFLERVNRVLLLYAEHWTFCFFFFGNKTGEKGCPFGLIRFSFVFLRFLFRLLRLCGVGWMLGGAIVGSVNGR